MGAQNEAMVKCFCSRVTTWTSIINNGILSLSFFLIGSPSWNRNSYLGGSLQCPNWFPNHLICEEIWQRVDWGMVKTKAYGIYILFSKSKSHFSPDSKLFCSLLVWEPFVALPQPLLSWNYLWVLFHSKSHIIHQLSDHLVWKTGKTGTPKVLNEWQFHLCPPSI